jgi:hypothetical protein
LRVYARTRCLFVNVREWRGGVVTGQARALIRINGLNRSNSGSPTTPASARKRCNAGSECPTECGKKTHSDCDKLCDMPESDSQTFMRTLVPTV